MALQGADRWILPFPDSVSEAAHGGSWIFSLSIGLLLLSYLSLAAWAHMAQQHFIHIHALCAAALQAQGSKPLSHSLQVTQMYWCKSPWSADALWRYQMFRQKGGWELGDKSCKVQHEEDLQKMVQNGWCKQIWISIIVSVLDIGFCPVPSRHFTKKSLPWSKFS